MTDLQLQDALKKELTEHFCDIGRKFPWADSLKEIHIHTQMLPLKDSKSEERDEDDDIANQWNYICIVIPEEKLSDGEWEVEVHFAVGIKDKDKDCQGYRHVANLMDEIFMHLVKNGVLAEIFSIDTEKAFKSFSMETEYPYYEGDLVTYWHILAPQREGLEELI